MAEACQYVDCVRESEKAGYCNAHYIRKRRGKPMDGPVRKSGDDPARFWEKVRRTEFCWEWTAFRSADGYGRFMIGRVPHLAHRVSFERTNGTIPDGMEVDHACRNRGCVNPSHLRLATRSLNAQNLGGARADSSSGIRGVRFRSEGSSGRWTAQAQVDGRTHYLGSFRTARAAEAAVTEFRRQNMPFSIMDQAGVA